MMLMLGIESSCDETAAAVVAEVDDVLRPWQIRSNVVASQVEIHREWGGVVPELASRQHIRDICGVVEKALSDARVTLGDIGAVAVTVGPGLVGSLLVGLSFAKSLASSLEIPLVPVHHLAGHIESLFLEHGPLPLPAVVLVVSGGHTSLYEVPAPGIYNLMGRTRDDAAGEAYDKVAKLLGLGYPGGPVIDRIAGEGDDRAIDFPVARMTHRDRNQPERPGRLDFSFSGIKTAVLRYVREATGHRPQATGEATGEATGQRPQATGRGTGAGGWGPGAGSGRPGSGRWAVGSGQTAAGGGQPAAGSRQLAVDGAKSTAAPLGPREIANICASFQRAVVEALLDRTFEAASRIGARSVGIAGGVSANSRLRADSQSRGARMGLPVFVPPLALSTDNAAMIAAAGLRRFHMGVRAGRDINADASLKL